MGAVIYRRSWAFPLLGSILVLGSAFRILRPDRRSTDNPAAIASKGHPSLPGHRRINPRPPHQTPYQNLMFDPVLVYSTFLGGASVPSGNSAPMLYQGVTVILVNASGNLLVAGSTAAEDFPVTSGVVQATNPQSNTVGFLSEIDPTGHLIFSTYLFGMNTASAIAVDAAGDIYVAGVSQSTVSPQLPLPIPSGTMPFDPTPKPISIVKLNGTATAIVNATYLGGSGVDDVSGLALDATGNVYVAGYTTSNDFPTLDPLQGSLGASGHNVFVTKLNSTLSKLVYSTYLGQDSLALGAGADAPTGTASHGIAVDSSGDAYVVGVANSGFPTTSGAVQPTCSVDSTCAFLVELNPAGSSLLSSTYVGGGYLQNGVFVSAVAVDGSQDAYVAGGVSNLGTSSVNSVAPCPTTPPPGAGPAGNGFVLGINAAGDLTFSTCLGQFSTKLGFSKMGVDDMVLDASGNIYVVGTGALQLPLTNPIQSDPALNVFVAAINPQAPALLFSSLVGGGASVDTPTAVGVDASGNLYAAGLTTNISGGPTSPYFPVFNALQPDPGACANCLVFDGFVLEIAPTNAAAAALAPGQLTFPVEPVGTTTSDQTVTIYDMGSAPLTVSNVTVTGDFSLDGNGCGSVVAAAGGTCTIAVNFTPTVTGTRNGTLTITDNSAGSPHTVQLTGQGGEGSVSLSPSSLSFSSQQVGTTSAAQTVTLTNTGALALQVSHIQASTPFDETNTCGTSLPAAGMCTISVSFSPTTAGAATGTLTLTDSAANSPQTVALSGSTTTGAPLPPPGIGLGVASGGSATATVAAGATATYALSIGGSGMAGTASLTCTGAPTGATCSVPASVPLNATTASTFKVSVSTTARSLLLFTPVRPTPWLLALALLAGLALLLTTASAQHPRRWRLAPLMALVLCACGGGSTSMQNPNGTTAGTYTLVVTAKSGSTTQTQNLTLTVQ